MRTVSATLARRQLSKLLRETAVGEEVVITLRGKPVARLSRLPALPIADPTERERIAKEMIEELRKGYHLGGAKVDREELYDRLGPRSKP